MKAYKFNYFGYEEIGIIANNFTGKGGFDFHIVLLGGENETIYNADSTEKCLEFMNNPKEINIPLPKNHNHL